MAFQEPQVPAGTEEYMKRHQVSQMFENAVRKLVMEQPEDPVAFLKRAFAYPDTLKIMISGAPASGKGTQCELIVQEYGLTHISSGDILRAEAEAGTELGLQAKEYMSAGKLVPNELMIELIKGRLEQEDCIRNGWLLDGFPRTRQQAIALQNAGILPDAFILLQVPDQVLVERVSGRRVDPVTGAIYHLTSRPPETEEIRARLVQRADDTEEVVSERIKIYSRHTHSIVDCYEKMLTIVDGNRPPNVVFEDIRKAVAISRGDFSSVGEEEGSSSS